jgi:hypothetical protein
MCIRILGNIKFIIPTLRIYAWPQSLLEIFWMGQVNLKDEAWAQNSYNTKNCYASAGWHPLNGITPGCQPALA